MKHIFVVEDDQGIRELLEYLLISQEYSVNTFPTVESFKRTIAIKTPDLILMDVMLPDGNGLEMCRALSGNQDTNHIPVLLMSAHIDIKGSESCARDFIAKPFDINELLEKVQSQLV